MWMRVGARLIVLIVFAVVMSSLWFGGYVVFLSAINSLDVAANLSEILNEALWMGAPALCVASVAWVGGDAARLAPWRVSGNYSRRPSGGAYVDFGRRHWAVRVLR